MFQVHNPVIQRCISIIHLSVYAPQGILKSFKLEKKVIKPHMPLIAL